MSRNKRSSGGWYEKKGWPREFADFCSGTRLLRFTAGSCSIKWTRDPPLPEEKTQERPEEIKMERSIGRQGPMMSPGMGRRPGGMPPRDSYQPHSYHPQQQQRPDHHTPSRDRPSDQVNNIQQQQQPSQFQHSQHDELIRYIHEAWNSITQDKSQAPPVFYKSVPEPRLAGFTPFDLEAWWGRRLVHNISTHGHQ